MGKKPKSSLTVKQISRKLKKHPKNQVVAAIEQLIEEEKLFPVSANRFRIQSDNLSSGTSYTGIVDLTQSGNAYILVEGLEKDIFVPADKVNRAFDGDKVKVDVTFRHRHNRPVGRITEILERTQKEYVGTISISSGFAFMLPYKKTIPVDIYIPLDHLKGKKVEDGDRVVVRISHWPDDFKNPVGEIVDVLGKPEENDTEMKSILIENGFPIEFPKEALKELANIPEEIPEEEISRRKDLRKVVTLTIDPYDAKDFDDALSVRKVGKDRWEVGIHIADVSHYVQPGTALDKEAIERATSVYLVDRVNPMLPERLSNELCSLRPDEDKLAFSALFQMDEEGTVHRDWFGKTIIRSNRRFAYQEVQKVIDEGKGPYAKQLLLLWKFSKKLRALRFSKGSINFETEEVRFTLDDEGKPIAVRKKERLEAHMLVEDMMLLANRRVARYMSSKKGQQKPVPFVYRIHDEPDIDRLTDLSKVAAELGHRVRFDNPDKIPFVLNKLIAHVHDKPEEHLINQLAIRSMAKAEYSTKNVGHYGLAFETYTHFTSPIRRYPDVLVHRILHDKLSGRSTYKDEEKLEKLCVHSSFMERKAMKAEFESIRYKQVEYLLPHVGEEFDGLISGVTHFGIFVELLESKCEGMISTRSFRKKLEFNEAMHRLTSHDGTLNFQLGDSIRVKLKDASLAKRTLDFIYVEED